MEPTLRLGQYLRQQREEQKISLESVALITRISPAHLRFLEEDAFHLLPAEIFTRGFLRSYAQSLKLNPEEVLASYRRQKERENLERGMGAAPPAHSFLKAMGRHLLDFLATLAGAAPALSGKTILPPKEYYREP